MDLGCDQCVTAKFWFLVVVLIGLIFNVAEFFNDFAKKRSL